MNKMRFFIKFWVLLSFIIALYGCFQQWFGYLPMEINYIMSTPGTFELLFQGGQLRKFSFLSDVVSFGVLAGSMAVFTIILAIGTPHSTRKYMLFFFALIMMLGMAYSGTRTTTIIIPVGLILYGFITIQNKTTLITLFIGVLFAMGVLFAPIYTNPTLNRVRSTFDSKDESLNLRDRNRHYIQPYLYQHPIGGGIGTTNVPTSLSSAGRVSYRQRPTESWIGIGLGRTHHFDALSALYFLSGHLLLFQNAQQGTEALYGNDTLYIISSNCSTVRSGNRWPISWWDFLFLLFIFNETIVRIR
jgi:hypothetical protein